MAVHSRRYRLDRATNWARSLLSESPALPSQLLAVAIFVVLGASEAGFTPTVWYPAALFLLAILAVTFAVIRLHARPRPLALAGLALLGAYALWSYFSITWAEQEADAWDAGNRAAAYLVVLALFTVWPIGPRGARLLVGLFALGIAGLGLVEILRADSSAFPGGFFIDVRFAEPAGYINANVALWTLGLMGCLALAAGRQTHPALRGIFLGSGALLAGLALLGQSRGWAVAVPVGLAVLLVLSPDRPRVALGALGISLGVFAVSRPLLDVHDAYTPERFDGLLADATVALILMAVLVGTVWGLWALAERRLRPFERIPRRFWRGAAAALAAVALVVGAIALVGGGPADRVEEAWAEFKEGGGPEADGSRFASGGSNRYDFWTVAWDAFLENPARGLGAENFQRHYLRVGDSTEKPRYPHSLELGVVSQLGLVGALLLGGALAALVVASARVRRAEYERRALAAAAAAVFAYWLAHASVDWFWEFPGLTAPALAMLGTATALAPRTPVHTDGEGDRRPRSLTAAAAAAAVVAAALAVSFVAPWLSALYVERASAKWRDDPGGALDDLDRAAWLNPLSDVPDATAATIELRLGRVEQARARFADVLARDPRNSYAALELGLIAADEGRRRQAIHLLRLSLAQNPRDSTVRDVLEDVIAGEEVSVSAVNALIARRARSTANRPSGGGE
jgi:tetratricopeptide (TPR) repeat protein